jgi:hypothetical protein
MRVVTWNMRNENLWPCCFTKKSPPWIRAYIVTIDKPIKIVITIKLMGLNISNNVRWNRYMEENVKKAFTRLYFVRQLKLAIIAEKELLTFYMISIRPIVEYACPVFHSGSSKY